MNLLLKILAALLLGCLCNCKIHAQALDTSYKTIPAIEPPPVKQEPSNIANVLEGSIRCPAFFLRKNRVWLVAGAHAAVWTGSFMALHNAWYAGYPKSFFYCFNDNREWKQMDKAGHVWSTYHMSRLSAGLWRWTGLTPRTATWLGGISGIAYQSIIEIQDGFSAEWGFSWGDMVANSLGAAAFVAQELGWKEQRIQIKFSYRAYDYEGKDLVLRRNQLFGSGPVERILKDYNAQTYWISANLQSFWRNTKLPSWLNMAIGYNSQGMLGGFDNTWTDAAGNSINRHDIARTRRFLLSPDIDLTRIRSRHRWVRSLLSVANMIKIPAPALELNSKGLRFHAVYF